VKESQRQKQKLVYIVPQQIMIGKHCLKLIITDKLMPISALTDCFDKLEYNDIHNEKSEETVKLPPLFVVRITNIQ
jgi:hypothetical protein